MDLNLPFASRAWPPFHQVQDLRAGSQTLVYIYCCILLYGVPVILHRTLLYLDNYINGYARRTSAQTRAWEKEHFGIPYGEKSSSGVLFSRKELQDNSLVKRVILR